MWLSVLIGVIAGVAGVSFLQYRAQKGTYRPLSSRQPSLGSNETERDVPLGMEEIDMQSVNRVNRRNAALERSNMDWIKGRGKNQIKTAADGIEPLPDDETYAKRFHSAFMKNKSKD
jgi:hypothetical protein